MLPERDQLELDVRVPASAASSSPAPDTSPDAARGELSGTMVQLAGRGLALGGGSGSVDDSNSTHGFVPSNARGESPDAYADSPTRVQSTALHRRTVWKLDLLLLPFLALLFLFNSLDRANIGNAETAHFTRDVGLEKEDLNTAVALFFAFFVTLQPVGAALGRRYGMVVWVPSSGFYPVTVSYLSLFYTRFEFGRRLSLFYGQAAVGGALGGMISYYVFSRFRNDSEGNGLGQTATAASGWKPWQVLFLLEGGLTIVVALIGYFWLPHSAATAWFLTPPEREYATQRIVADLAVPNTTASQDRHEPLDVAEDDNWRDEESHGLLGRATARSRMAEVEATDDRGLAAHDIVSAIFNLRIWHILVCNILSAIPVYAFQVFLPLVLAPLTSSSTPDPALVNLLTVPPYVCGAVTLYLFASYSDRHQKRLHPILAGLAILIMGLIFVVCLPTTKGWVIPRYMALNLLLAGTFIASPLTVAWISGNTPSPGKRALLLGINGWGNLAGIFSALLFKPKYAESGYVVPFWWTLVFVVVSAGGYVLFYRGVKGENERRKAVMKDWDEADLEKERSEGRGPVVATWRVLEWTVKGLRSLPIPLGVRLAAWLEDAVKGGREGDERMTFVYGI